MKKLFWKNWAGNQTCFPDKIFYPTTCEALKSIIKSARESNKTIGVYGSSHSWSPLVEAEYLISMAKLNHILSLDRAAKTVRVEDGMRLYDLNRALAQSGLALPNQAYTQAETIAGAIATATHGTGHTGTFSEFVNTIEIVTPAGTLKVLTKNETPEEFAAACTHLGALGIIYAVTLTCVPLFNVVHNRTLSSWQATKVTFEKDYQENDFFMFFINPYTNQTIHYRYNKTEAPATRLQALALKIKQKGFLNRILGSLWIGLLTFKPQWTPSVIDALYRGSRVRNVVGRCYDVMTGIPTSFDSPFYFEEEIGIPRAYTPHAIDAVIELIKNYQNKNFYVFPTGVLVRFTQADKQGLLSMATGRESAFISITTSSYNEQFFKDLEKLFVTHFEGRPHWGKVNFVNAEIAQTLYKERFDTFSQIRNVLDPLNLFMNPYKKSLFKK